MATSEQERRDRCLNQQQRQTRKAISQMAALYTKSFITFECLLVVPYLLVLPVQKMTDVITLIECPFSSAQGPRNHSPLPINFAYS
jgi:hypothetical protein